MKLILASGSPRRRELLARLDIPFEVRLKEGIDESYPVGCPAHMVPQYIASKKAEAYTLSPDEVLLTADTMVIVDDEILGKPHDEADERRMLHLLSGRTHKVITGVCIRSGQGFSSEFPVETEVTFGRLSDSEIDYYIRKYKPYDKAGAYGIQEWIGYIGVTGIRGSYFNVMGLPVQRIYQELSQHCPELFNLSPKA